MNRFFALCLVAFSLTLSACATQHKTQVLSPEEQSAMISQPFVMSIAGQHYKVNNFAEFAQLMQSKPRAFVTYILEDQYNAAYHLHLKSNFRDIGYAQSEEGFVEVKGIWTEPQKEAQESVSTKKGKKKSQKATAQTRRFYKQTFFADGIPGQTRNNQNQSSASSNTNWGSILSWALPVAVTTGLSIWALSR